MHMLVIHFYRSHKLSLPALARVHKANVLVGNGDLSGNRCALGHHHHQRLCGGDDAAH